MSPRALLFAELSDGMRTGRFWAIVARNAIPLAGVVWLGWPAGLLVVFYVIEIWWFLSLRMAAEIAVEDELKGDTPMSAGRLTGLTLVKFLPGALVIGVLFFTVASLFIVALFTHWDWRAFVTGVAAKEFVFALAILAVFLLVESVRYGLRYYRAGAKAEREDELRMMAIFYRVPCLIFAGPFLYFLLPFRHGMEVVALFLLLTSVWIEGTPRHVARVFGMPKAMRRTLFKRT